MFLENPIHEWFLRWLADEERQGRTVDVQGCFKNPSSLIVDDLRALAKDGFLQIDGCMDVGAVDPNGKVGLTEKGRRLFPTR